MIRFPRVRFTVRGMMVVVLGLAIVLHLTITAWQVHRSGGDHLHSAIFQEPGADPAWGVAVRHQPFWSTFWRRLIGWSSKAQQTCLIGHDAMMERCELSNPEIRLPMGPTMYAAVHLQEQIEHFEKLKQARGSTVR